MDNAAAPQEDAPLPLIERLREFKRVYRRPTADFGHDDACIDAAIAALAEKDAALEAERKRGDTLWQECDSLRLRLNTPEIHDFEKAVVLEAAHQRERWGASHDGGKTPADWFWLVGYLAGKALHAHAVGDIDKALHHVITTAAACCNWHAAMRGQTNMRPGIEPPTAALGSEKGAPPKP